MNQNKTRFSAAVITASDTGAAGARIDESGKVMQEILEAYGFHIKYYEVIPDDFETIKEKLIYLCDTEKVDLVITTGGTGFSERDVTPEATKEVIKREVPGVSEAIRYYGMQKTPRSMLSRGISGIRDRTLIINLPGSPKAVRESLEGIIDTVHHGLDILKGISSECARK
ncbi:MAG: molybdenum cofactor biosynthesis protein [Clostridia bacterium]|jgi:molybdenum cofactor synthesis domain-containing protein|nr:molybdenum cofactor biosynthesis protein [Clostridia bacterium]